MYVRRGVDIPFSRWQANKASSGALELLSHEVCLLPSVCVCMAWQHRDGILSLNPCLRPVQRRLGGVRNMPVFLSGLQEHGWRVVGADAAPQSVTVADLPLDDKSPVMLVVVGGACFMCGWNTYSDPDALVTQGNEGKGLRTMVRRSCTDLVRASPSMQRAQGGLSAQAAELTDADNLVDSLNVSVAAGSFSCKRPLWCPTVTTHTVVMASCQAS